MSQNQSVDLATSEPPELLMSVDETLDVQWKDPAVFDPALSKRGPLASVRTLMYLAELPGFLHARPAIKLEISPTEEGRFSVFAPLLRLGGVGDSFEGATRDFISTIESLWTSLVEEDPSTLTADAGLLARRLRSSFRRSEK